MLIRLLSVMLLSLPSPAFTQEPPRTEAARLRFPQPVQVTALAGRQVLENRLNQRVLGRVEAITRDDSGQVYVLLHRATWPWQPTRCAVVPAGATALLGQFLVVMDLDDAAFEALPNQCRAPGAVLPGTETIHLGLTKN